MVDGFVRWEDTVDPGGCNTDDPINYVSSSHDPERWSSEKNAGFSSGDKTWLPIADSYETLNVEVHRNVEWSNLNVYKTLIKLRAESVFRYGRYESAAFNSDVLAFRRWYNGEIYVVMVNLRDLSYTVDLTYFDNVTGDLEIIVNSIQSPKNEGDIVEAKSLNVSGSESVLLKVVQ